MVLLLAACGRQTQGADASQTPTWQEQYDLGVRYLEEGNYEEAIIAFTAAIEIDPKQAETYEKLADAYVALGDSESALEVLRQGAEAIGDDTLFQVRIDELTAKTEQSTASSSESASSPRVEREDLSGGRYSLLYYDEAGNLIRDETYFPDGTLDLYGLRYYDTAGRMTRVEYYVQDGKMGWYTLYYYDETGNMTQMEDYGTDGTLRGYSLSYYDAEGNWTQTEYYDAAGNLTSTETFD